MALQTITTECLGELEDRKSRFLASLVPIAAFDARLSELRAEHRKANHHVTAFRRMMDDGRIEEGARDDGEPAGTSGMPCLKVLQGAELVDVGVIIVRYFGGVKLGGGGLARAYSGAVQNAIERSDRRPWLRMGRKTVTAGFNESSALEQRAAQAGLTIEARVFDETGVSLTLSGPADMLGTF
ncbi:YigZ family protein [Breoghania sp. L-A4]|uniref:IMPACT family protein n=1 Tax=Breoghania sp. L-A4 TaxID=2304600 RepID=UPI000E35C01C|nr:YigZ family protein [Breoghania sp. L-A4]AXS39630.1 phosphoenolpyruvate carboxykinase [Breoghania sp. L-A4]